MIVQFLWYLYAMTILANNNKSKCYSLISEVFVGIVSNNYNGKSVLVFSTNYMK